MLNLAHTDLWLRKASSSRSASGRHMIACIAAASNPTKPQHGCGLSVLYLRPARARMPSTRTVQALSKRDLARKSLQIGESGVRKFVLLLIGLVVVAAIVDCFANNTIHPLITLVSGAFLGWLFNRA